MNPELVLSFPLRFRALVKVLSVRLRPLCVLRDSVVNL
ncbi:hypothetical protein Pla175_39640 [Pirellulimonas nuda]|uniref:Uncharacterized protein n=1 Tax=Pirellulimonas nuda TaxID=2528009 RepID=A0A518DGF5_9BACT|nr:hypothetical protein Pla175_39640 [Pirellulimonas nuda]